MELDSHMSSLFLNSIRGRFGRLMIGQSRNAQCNTLSASEVSPTSGRLMGRATRVKERNCAARILSSWQLQLQNHTNEVREALGKIRKPQEVMSADMRIVKR